MKVQKVRQLMELLESCNPDADVYMTLGVNEITDIISVDQPGADIVIVRSDEDIYRRRTPIYPQICYDVPAVVAPKKAIPVFNPVKIFILTLLVYCVLIFLHYLIH